MRAAALLVAALLAVVGVVVPLLTPVDDEVEPALQRGAPGPEETPDFVVPQDLFAHVNGVRLHYLDWGGEGDLMLFLHGVTSTAHAFNGIAPAFADRYHVIGLTRRGHGASDTPEIGYDLETLVDDIVAFINVVGSDRVILVGHSFAGLELPLVAARFPSRTAAIILLDAVYDWPATETGYDEMNPLWQPPTTAFASRGTFEDWFRRRYPNQWGQPFLVHLRSKTYITEDGGVAWQLSGEPLGQLFQTMWAGTDYSGIQAPVLAVWANQTEPEVQNMLSYGYPEADIERLREWASTTEVEIKRRGLDLLKRSVPGAVIVEMQAPHELMWYAPDRVVRVIDDFLGRQRTRR